MNYYKILEVDRDASPEVIEKAYKTLAKKYHPDLQESNMKQEAEEKLKLINEAYETLSNPDSRAKYDETLKQNEISKEDYNRLSQENRNLYNEINDLKQNNYNNNYQNNYNNNNNYSNIQNNNNIYQEKLNEEEKYQRQLEYENQIQQAKQKAYHDAYIQDLKNRGYRIKYKKTPREHLKNFIALLITIAILFLLSQIPFIKNFFIKMYNENVVIQYIVNFISNLFN